MILHDFPNLQWLRKQAETKFANRQSWQGSLLPQAGWPSVVMNVKTCQTSRDNIPGPLSIFTNLAGTSHVQVGGKVSTIRPDFFFLSNESDRYTLEIETKRETETLNVHFGESWADQVLRTQLASPETLLDECVFSQPMIRVEVRSKIYEKTEHVNSLLLALKQSEGNQLLEEELLFKLLIELLHANKHVRELEATLPSLKHSTKQEILRRLHDCTDYIYSNLDKEISLQALAETACLSKFHFLRLFSAAFKKTPHQFISEVKVKQATTLLAKTSLDVKSISSALGFKDSSTFSRLYFNHTGKYPSQIRPRK